MVKTDIYKNAGKYSHNDTDAYNFANGELTVELSTDCCDYWETRCPKKTTLYCDGGSREFRDLEQMDGEYINTVIVQEDGLEYLIDSSDDDDDASEFTDKEPCENGSVTLISDKYFTEVQYWHFHNGYYPINFMYHTTLTEA